MDFWHPLLLLIPLSNAVGPPTRVQKQGPTPGIPGYTNTTAARPILSCHRYKIRFAARCAHSFSSGQAGTIRHGHAVVSPGADEPAKTIKRKEPRVMTVGGAWKGKVRPTRWHATELRTSEPRRWAEAP